MTRIKRNIAILVPEDLKESTRPYAVCMEVLFVQYFTEVLKQLTNKPCSPKAEPKSGLPNLDVKSEGGYYAVHNISSEEGSEINIFFFDVKHSQPPREADWANYDGFLVTGGSDSASKDDPWIKNLEQCVAGLVRLKKPIFGICFGHQVLAKALGSTVRKNDYPYQGGMRSFKLSNDVTPLLKISPNQPWSPVQTEISLLYSHGDIVTNVPCGDVYGLGKTEKCPVHGLLLGNPPFGLTLQAHPEFATPSGTKCVRDIIELKYKQDVISEKEYADALEKHNEKGDSIRMGTFFMSLLMADK